jgi:hypothetical protein
MHFPPFVGAAQLTVVASYIIESSRLKVSRALISFEWWSFRTRVMARVSIVGTRKCGIKTRTFQLILEKIAAAVDSTDNRITIDTLEPIVKVAGYVFEIRGRGFGTNQKGTGGLHYIQCLHILWSSNHQQKHNCISLLGCIFLLHQDNKIHPSNSSHHQGMVEQGAPSTSGPSGQGTGHSKDSQEKVPLTLHIQTFS